MPNKSLRPFKLRLEPTEIESFANRKNHESSNQYPVPFWILDSDS